MMIKTCRCQPFLVDSRMLRKGILLQLTNEEGNTGVAEISPLPGHSKETFEEALAQIDSLKKTILSTDWTKERVAALQSLPLYPSVLFGLESGLLDLLDPIPENISCLQYALMLGSPSEILSRAEEIYEEGYRQAKVKLGHLTPKTAHHIIDTIQDKFRLRIDLNCKWSLQDSLSFFAAYPDNHFEYIEEPVSRPEDLIHFPYPFALDETLRKNIPLTPFLQMKACTTLILKPTLLYPLSSFLHLGKKIVLTSSFEGPVGNKKIKQLAIRLGIQSTHHGLDTLRYFEKGPDYDLLPYCGMEKAAT